MKEACRKRKMKQLRTLVTEDLQELNLTQSGVGLEEGLLHLDITGIDLHRIVKPIDRNGQDEHNNRKKVSMEIEIKAHLISIK